MKYLHTLRVIVQCFNRPNTAGKRPSTSFITVSSAEAQSPQPPSDFRWIPAPAVTTSPSTLPNLCFPLTVSQQEGGCQALVHQTPDTHSLHEPHLQSSHVKTVSYTFKLYQWVHMISLVLLDYWLKWENHTTLPWTRCVLVSQERWEALWGSGSHSVSHLDVFESSCLQATHMTRCPQKSKFTEVGKQRLLVIVV